MNALTAQQVAEFEAYIAECVREWNERRTSWEGVGSMFAESEFAGRAFAATLILAKLRRLAGGGE